MPLSFEISRHSRTRPGTGPGRERGELLEHVGARRVRLRLGRLLERRVGELLEEDPAELRRRADVEGLARRLVDLRLERGEPRVELLRQLGEDAAVDGDAGDLHPREDGHERQLDLLEDARERRALGEARRERVREREREAGARRELAAARPRTRERRGATRPPPPASVLQRRHGLRREVEDAARVAREVVRVEARRDDVAREHRVEEARGRRDPERVGREEEALGVVRDDGDVARRAPRAPSCPAASSGEGGGFAARRAPTAAASGGAGHGRARPALDVDGRAARLRGRGDERVEAGASDDPTAALSPVAAARTRRRTARASRLGRRRLRRRAARGSDSSSSFLSFEKPISS